MTCSLPAPQWIDFRRSGLLSAVENIVDSTIVLSWGDARAVVPGTEVHYLIYWSTTRDTLFTAPKAVTTETTATIPTSMASLSNYFAVRVAQLGVSADISSANMVEIDGETVSIPSNTDLRLNLGLADGYVSVDSTAGFPDADGYLQVEEEIILYSAKTTYSGGPAFIISDRDPFGCNTVTTHDADGYTEVSLFLGFDENNNSSFKASGACYFNRPEWSDLNAIGLQSIEDLGIGTSVELVWKDAVVPSGFSRVYYNIYRSNSLYTLLAGSPIGISTATEVIDPNLQPGDGYYYAVRATYHLENIDFDEADIISDNFWAFPDSTQIDEVDGYFSEGEVGNIKVVSTDGFPSAGQLKVGREVVTYTAKGADYFTVSERDIFNMELSVDYANGTEVTYFKGIEDANNVFYRTTPSWIGSDTRLYPPTVGDGYDGYLYMQDADGYRSNPVDNVTENHAANDRTADDTPTQSYCGLRSDTFVDLYQGNACGTFIGGSQKRVIAGLNGNKPVPVAGGINVFERNLQREEMLLGLSGEPFILFRRKWTGKVCPGISHRHEHPSARCGICYGTGFEGGYDKYSNQRAIRPGEVNTNGFIQLRVSPYSDDLSLTQDRGLAQDVIIEAWTMAVPTIKDRDILVRYVVDPEGGLILEEFRYEVLNVNRNKLLFGGSGKQTIQLKRLDKTEEVYKLDTGV